MKCPKCNNEWTAKFTHERKALKSNVDVYLASDMIARASIANHPTRLILVSCDGDYAEAIKTAINLNKNISIAVLATPKVKDLNKNALSVRLRQLAAQISRYILQDITSIQNYIEEKKITKNGSTPEGLLPRLRLPLQATPIPLY